MATLRERKHTIAIGMTVFSEKVGVKAEFWGRVTHHGSGSNGPYYHVQDFADGTEWHRTRSEITTQDEVETAA